MLLQPMLSHWQRDSEIALQLRFFFLKTRECKTGCLLPCPSSRLSGVQSVNLSKISNNRSGRHIGMQLDYYPCMLFDDLQIASARTDRCPALPLGPLEAAGPLTGGTAARNDASVVLPLPLKSESQRPTCRTVQSDGATTVLLGGRADVGRLRGS
jgi:hypothetical protein